MNTNQKGASGRKDEERMLRGLIEDCQLLQHQRGGGGDSLFSQRSKFVKKKVAT
jgi:hypothetical protein